MSSVRLLIKKNGQIKTQSKETSAKNLKTDSDWPVYLYFKQQHILPNPIQTSLHFLLGHNRCPFEGNNFLTQAIITYRYSPTPPNRLMAAWVHLIYIRHHSMSCQTSFTSVLYANNFNIQGTVWRGLYLYVQKRLANNKPVVLTQWPIFCSVSCCGML